MFGRRFLIDYRGELLKINNEKDNTLGIYYLMAANASAQLDYPIHQVLYTLFKCEDL
jgi:hypothetical protein